MLEKVLSNDLDNCLINFNRKVFVTNLLDEYGGLLEEIAKTVNEFLSTEEAKGKKFLKTFLLRGVESDSENEVITVVSEEKLKQREEELKDACSMLYSAEADGGSKSPPYEFVPLKRASIQLDSLVVKDAAVRVSNGTTPPAADIKEEKQPPKKTGALGTMFKKQEATAAAKKSTEEATPKKSTEEATPKKSGPEKKPGALDAMFKKQEATKKSPKPEPKKSAGTLGAMFKKQQSTATSATARKSPETEKIKKPAPASKKGITSSITKKEEGTKPSVLKPPTPKKVNEFFKKEVKEEPATANVSVNLFEESASSSDDEEALDALKRDVLTDDDEDKPSSSNKRRRIIDSDDEDTGPEVKVERKEVAEEVIEIEDDKSKASETFMDEDGFIVTVKAKNKKPAVVSKPTPTPVKIKKESPKSPAKKTSSKTPAAKTKQGNIMSFFAKK